MDTLKAVLRLYAIHLSAFLAVGLSTYYPPCDIILSLLYLIIIALEARSLKKFKVTSKLTVILAWQGPGLFLALLAISNLVLWDLSNYAFFIMLFWYTPLIPFLSLLPGVFWGGYPLYYYGLLTMPLLMGIFHYLAGQTRVILNWRR